MKTIVSLMAACAILFTPFLLLSQDGDVGEVTPETEVTAETPLPVTVEDYWMFAIAAVTPFIVSGIRKLVPRIPKGLLPAMTPVLGIALGFSLNQLGAAEMGWVDMTQAGALAVFVREVWDQNVTKRNEEPDTLPKEI